MTEYVKHSGGSHVGKSKKFYDVMVYKDSTTGYTVAVDSNGNLIKKVLSASSTDDIVIEAGLATIATGGTLYVAAGTYALPDYLYFGATYNDITVIGDGDTTIFRLGDAAPSHIGNDGIFHLEGGDRLIFRDFKIDGNSAGQVQNYSGFRLFDTHDTFIENVTIHDAKYAGIMAFGWSGSVERITIRDCFIDTPLSSGIHIDGTATRNWTIEGNYIYEPGAHGIKTVGIDANGPEVLANLRIVDNYIYKTTGTSYGIHALNLFDSVIANNTIDVAFTGINLSGNSRVSIIGNDIECIDDYCIYAESGNLMSSYVLIEGNSLVGGTNNDGGVMINSDNVLKVTHVSIIGNDITECNVGIYLHCSSLCTVVGNTVAFSKTHGIKIDGDEHIISDNLIVGNGTSLEDTYSGVYLQRDPATAHDPVRNLIYGNIFKEFGTTSTTLTADAGAGTYHCHVTAIGGFYHGQRVKLTEGATTEDIIISAITKGNEKEISFKTALVNSYTSLGGATIETLPCQKYGVDDDGNADYTFIKDNMFQGNVTSALSIGGANSKVKGNMGYTTENSGTAATITAGNTYVDVTHGLAAIPTKVRVTATTNLGTRSFWVDTKGAATFRININSSDVIDHTFDWEAEV